MRNRRTLGLVLTIPLIELFFFGYAVELTVDHLPTAVVAQSLDARGQAFISALEASGFFDVHMHLETESEVIRALDAGKIRAGIVIPPDFAAQIERGKAQVLIILDGSEAFSVQSGYSAAVAIAQNYGLELLVEDLSRQGRELSSIPITSLTRVLYNPDQADLVFVMPGIIALVLQVLAVNLTATSIVRESEMGTLEQLLVTPIRPLELMLGKMVPNIIVAAVDLVLIIVIGVFWFKVPFRGSLLLFAWLTALFLISSLGVGLLISTLVQTQKESQQMTAMLMMLSELVTGFIYPRAPMPFVVQAIGNLIPATYFIRIVRGIMTKGVGLSFMWEDVVALFIYAFLVMLLSAILFRRRLD
ncbi:MAG: ABC transporter permease [Anaerolineae bacterium]|nr:ABC transporter permease [Anaerolineae bacterium]